MFWISASANASVSSLLVFLAASLLLPNVSAHLIGNYTFAAIPLDKLYSPNIDAGFDITAYENSLKVANWSVGVETVVNATNFTTSISLTYPASANFVNTTTPYWDLCAITFNLGLNASKLSSPGFGTGDCTEIFSTKCTQDLVDTVINDGGFTAANCQSTGDHQLSVPASCPAAWKQGNSSLLSFRSVLNPPSAPARFLLDVVSITNVTNSTLVATQEVYPVMFLEISRVNGPPTYIAPQVAPFLCLQAVNNTVPFVASVTSTLPTSTGNTATATAKKSEGHANFGSARNSGLLMSLLFVLFG